MKIEDHMKTKITPPFNYIYILFVAETLLVGLNFFIFGGVNFFSNDTTGISFIISLGMLTFVSVFVGFILNRETSFLSSFRKATKEIREKFGQELEERTETKTITENFLKEFQAHQKALSELEFFANSQLWFYLSVFSFIISVIVGLSNIEGKAIILSVIIHFGILTTLFLITSISAAHIAFLREQNKEKTALIEYKIASSLPGTAPYDLIGSGKVWFWIANNENKKYKVYIKIEFLSENYHKIADSTYYDGKKPWNLNAFSGIRAPGLGIPKEVINFVKKSKRVEIKINCIIHDEYDKFVERKLPVSYIYDKGHKSWYFEP